MPKITKRVVDATIKAEKDVFVWDTELRGFGLRVFPSGRKIFVVQYRTLMGQRQRRHTIGTFGPLTAEEARDMARDLLSSIAKGGDPSGERAAARKELTVSDLLDLYIRDHAIPHQTKRSIETNEHLIKRHIRPRLGDLKIRAINRQDVARFMVALRDAPTSANRCLAVISKALNLAEEWGYRDQNTNPAAKQKKYAEHARERFLSVDELTRLGTTLLEAETKGLPWVLDETKPGAKHFPKPENRISAIDPTALNVMWVLLMTGARLSEICELEWAHVNFERETLSLPRQKGKPRRASPVSTAVMSFLARLPRPEGSPWVFPRIGDPGRCITVYVMQNGWQRVRRHAGLEDVHLHDLRHTVGTWAARMGASAFGIRDVLRHGNVTMTNKYVNADAEPIRELHNAVGSALNAALAGKKAEVIALTDRRLRQI